MIVLDHHGAKDHHDNYMFEDIRCSIWIYLMQTLKDNPHIRRIGRIVLEMQLIVIHLCFPPVFDLLFHSSLLLIESVVVTAVERVCEVRYDLIRDNFCHGAKPQRHLNLLGIYRKEADIGGSVTGEM